IDTKVICKAACCALGIESVEIAVKLREILSEVRQRANGHWKALTFSLDHRERLPIPAEKLFQIESTLSIVFDRCAGSDYSQLPRIWSKADAVKECAKQIPNFRSRRASVGMKFIDYEMEDISFAILRQPLGRAVENAVFNTPHQHDIEHAVVGD